MPCSIRLGHIRFGQLIFWMLKINFCQLQHTYFFFRFNQAQSELFLKFQCTVTLDGHYVMNGSIIVLPIRGDGRIHVVLSKSFSFIYNL